MRTFLGIALATVALWAQDRPTTDEIQSAVENARGQRILGGSLSVGPKLPEIRGWKLKYKQGKTERQLNTLREHSAVIARHGKDCVRYSFVRFYGLPDHAQIRGNFTFDRPEACR